MQRVAHLPAKSYPPPERCAFDARGQCIIWPKVVYDPQRGFVHFLDPNTMTEKEYDTWKNQ